jgi:hypothetical protein
MGNLSNVGKPLKMTEETKEYNDGSDFGKGTAYCLGLFLAHAERDFGLTKKYEKKMNKRFGHDMVAHLWFNGASDHLYELQIPETYPEDLKNRLSELAKKAIHWGHGFQDDATEEDKLWAINEAKQLLKLIDEHQGIETLEATWK